MIAISIAMAIWTALLVWMQVRTEKRRVNEHTVATVPGRNELGEIVSEQDHARNQDPEKSWR